MISGDVGVSIVAACLQSCHMTSQLPSASFSQGFTKEITMPREQWTGFIKDYDGGTLMEYVIHPKLPYAGLVNMFKVCVWWGSDRPACTSTVSAITWQ